MSREIITCKECDREKFLITHNQNGVYFICKKCGCEMRVGYLSTDFEGIKQIEKYIAMGHNSCLDMIRENNQ